uniref:NADH-ubiquinone oxidoreductase chain 5 n=1 Tax=Phyllophorella liuwutiensis TaxID=2810320 RepID=A0A890W0K4_9ECHN|nr:NADH dehydrogenase subunit 5 [Phyllophorella liuwutiensis]QRI59070.1 NADH dehydrogenase subunit 5 [Phyllophorella liuwutiensis]
MVINFFLINTTLSLSIFIILFLSSCLSNNSKNNNSIRFLNINTVHTFTIKTLSFIGITNFIIFFINNSPHITNLFPWNNNFSLFSHISIFIDNNFIFFSTTALLVTWSIIEFANYYMNNDPFSNNFSRLLIIFLLNMLILTASNNLFIFFIGWEGVGFLSFLLIGWWSSRNDANSAALQAIIYNRIGDIGILILISTILFSFNNWNLNSLLNNSNPLLINIILFSSLLAAIGKSAQFGLHPWLPAAMEGPTPVSALLHSSTMVVAGVFLLIRISENTPTNPNFLWTCTIVGSLTAIFAATTAFQQHDIKKIIAYSTTSQLGLMIIAIGFNNPNIALFHICTHAFFKAMLFLCSGSIIHSYNNEQDLRKLSNINESLPITSACLFLGSIALMGIPFLSGFFSKDLILELIIENPNNLLTYSLSIIATLLTAAYSFRIITFCFLSSPSNNSINPNNENNPNLFNPLIRLSIGTIASGWFLSTWAINTPLLIPNNVIKQTPLFITITGAIIASTLILFSFSNNFSTFFQNTWFFSRITHTISSNLSSNLALNMSSQTLDRGWSENIGGQGIFFLNENMSKNIQISQSSYIKQYLLSIFIIFFSSLIIILNI